jgi:hypothetical protein
MGKTPLVESREHESSMNGRKETLTEFELREGGVAERSVLDPEWLWRLAIERLAFARALA